MPGAVLSKQNFQAIILQLNWGQSFAQLHTYNFVNSFHSSEQFMHKDPLEMKAWLLAKLPLNHVPYLRSKLNLERLSEG